MNFSKEDQVIDMLMQKLVYGDYKILDLQHFKPQLEFDKPKDLYTIYKVAEDLDLIDRKGKRTIIWLTFKGYEIQKSGGWLKYLESENEKLNIEAERQSKSDEILDLDLRLRKFEAKLGKRIIVAGFIITLLSFLVSLLTINLFTPNTNDKENTKIELKSK